MKRMEESRSASAAATAAKKAARQRNDEKEAERKSAAENVGVQNEGLRMLEEGVKQNDIAKIRAANVLLQSLQQGKDLPSKKAKSS